MKISESAVRCGEQFFWPSFHTVYPPQLQNSLNRIDPSIAVITVFLWKDVNATKKFSGSFFVLFSWYHKSILANDKSVLATVVLWKDVNATKKFSGCFLFLFWWYHKSAVLQIDIYPASRCKCINPPVHILYCFCCLPVTKVVVYIL